jgi:hypothetical protein
MRLHPWASPFALPFLWRPSLRDADDDMVLEVAVNRQMR